MACASNPLDPGGVEHETEESDIHSKQRQLLFTLGSSTKPSKGEKLLEHVNPEASPASLSRTPLAIQSKEIFDPYHQTKTQAELIAIRFHTELEMMKSLSV